MRYTTIQYQLMISPYPTQQWTSVEETYHTQDADHIENIIDTLKKYESNGTAKWVNVVKHNDLQKGQNVTFVE